MNPKSKTTAVLLAVFLGPWTWVYTWRKDRWKFWVAVVLPPVTAYVFMVCAIFVSHTIVDSTDAMLALVTVTVLFPLALVAGGNWALSVAWITVCWLSPLILALMRPREFYEQYPDYKA